MKLWRPRFSILSLLLLTVAVALGLGWVRAVERENVALVRRIERLHKLSVIVKGPTRWSLVQPSLWTDPVAWSRFRTLPKIVEVTSAEKFQTASLLTSDDLVSEVRPETSAIEFPKAPLAELTALRNVKVLRLGTFDVLMEYATQIPEEVPSEAQQVERQSRLHSWRPVLEVLVRERFPLESLDLGVCRLTSADLRLLREIPTLKHLTLTMGHFEETANEDWPALESLTLSEVPVARVLPRLVNGKRLRSLQLNGCRLTPEDFENLAAIKQLEVLTVAERMSVATASLAWLTKLPNLRVLSLYDCVPTDELIPQLEAMPALQRLAWNRKRIDWTRSLRGSTWSNSATEPDQGLTDAGIARLRQRAGLELDDRLEPRSFETSIRLVD